MKTPPRWARLVASLLVAAGSVPATPAPARGGDTLGKVLRSIAAPVKAGQRQAPATVGDCAIEQLADEIDWLEHHIDRFGSIVAKHPDVWGQSRLTRYRDEVEKQLSAEVTKFKDLSNASLRRSDQSFLGMALAIQAASSGASLPGPESTTAVAQLITTGEGGIPIERQKPFAMLADDTLKGVFKLEENGIGLEPTIHLDHLSRYLNHLHELRRINEGDDIADSPGYSLNLVRIPVSILPGQLTQRGHGAEVSIIAEPQLGDDLLPVTFRNLVDNDLVDVLGPPLTFVANDPCVRGLGTETTPSPPGSTNSPNTPGTNPRPKALAESITRHFTTVRQAARSTTVSVPSTKSRRSRLPLPAEHVLDVVGERQFSVLIAATIEALANHPANKPCIQYTDVRSFLADELDGAQDFLAQPQLAGVWAELPSWRLPEVIRGRHLVELERLRDQFFQSLGTTSEGPCAIGEIRSADHPSVRVGGPRLPCCNTISGVPYCSTTTGVLAWMILVESALLDDRLADDMRQAATDKGLVSPAGGPWAGPFYGPDPAPGARRAFNDYVRLRWPIRIFALDPVAQEQNVEDAFSMQRETQIALALAAAQGARIGAQAMMRYARRLETDLATIGLNKTAVGFSHGSDTFGWRFYPRIQTPPTRNNLVNFAETLVGSNSQRRDLAERRIEPGIRECTAIVVMPSFVPYVHFDIRTNWFALNEPKHTDQSIRQTLELSRSVKAMQMSAARCSQCAGAYRDGEVARLLRRVEQLERELPLQSMLAQIPYENTSGGFELFNTGVTDLAPELIGWYGADGIDPTRPTTLYLVGKGFSVLDTSIIAGGARIPIELVSRQLLKATFPAGLRASLHGSSTPPACVSGDAPTTECAGTRPLGRDGTRDAGSRVLVRRTQALVRHASHEPEPSPLPAPLGFTGADPGGEAHVGNVDSAKDSPHAAMQPFTREYPVTPQHVQGNAPANPYDCNGRAMLDVHLATPYGVSGHLLVPVLPKPEPVPAPCPPHALSFSPQATIRMFFKLTGTADSPTRIDDFFFVEPDAIAIRTPDAFIPPAKADINLTLKDVGDPEHPVTVATLTIPAPPFNARGQRYDIDGRALRNLVGDTSRPATDTTLRGGLKPYFDFLFANGDPPVFTPGIPRLFAVSGVLSTDGYTTPIEGAVDIEATPYEPRK